MLSFIDLALSATKRHPPILDFVKSWLETASSGAAHVLLERQWFVEGHRNISGRKDHRGVWMPLHAANGRSYIWAPPPVIADVALEECLKAMHKRTDAYHMLLIPRLYSPLWLRLFYKLPNFVFHVSPGSRFWPSSMHEPLFVGISLPMLSRAPWTLRGMLLLVGMERSLCKLPDCNETNGGNILRELLRIPRRVAGLSKGMARKLLRLPGSGEVSGEGDNGRGGEHVVLGGEASPKDQSRS
jgi:hypothetical protein